MHVKHLAQYQKHAPPVVAESIRSDRLKCVGVKVQYFEDSEIIGD